MKHYSVFLSFIMAFFSAIGVSSVADDTVPIDGLRPPLDQVLRDSAPDALVPVSIVLKEKVGHERLARATAGIFDKDERRKIVLDLLKAQASVTQADLQRFLDHWRLEGAVERIRPLWIGNVIGVDATPDIIRQIARRPEVAWVNHNPKVDIFLGLKDRPQDLEGPVGIGEGPVTPTEIECGTQKMRAPEVWNDLGLNGAGAVIAVIDSGVCYDHPDITNNIWINPGEDLDGDGVVMDPDDMNGVDDDGNGFIDDVIGWNFEFGTKDPDDNNSHGSHVAGTVAGDGTSGTEAGVAPGASIMVVRVGLTFSDEVDVWNGMQYAADNGADSISMSLGWPHNQNPDRATWRQSSENTIDAGTAMVIAAGNEGSGADPDNIRTPGDVPRIISVAAVDCNDAIAGFSSRGPVSWENVDPFFDYPYPPGLTKPDVSGPGVNTKSHAYCSGYSNKSGTSMATPHVAGAVALMVSANPGLAHDEIKQVLEDTAIELGAAGKDNVYGSGRVDAFEAVSAVFGLSVESVDFDDTDPARGNSDGGLDTGELVTLRISLKNQRDDVTSQNIRGWLSSGTPGVTVANNHGTWADIGPSAILESSAPHFTFRVEEGCNYPIDFRLKLRYDGRETISTFTLRVGSSFNRDLIVDDFETDQGWTVSGSSAEGIWERADPNWIRDDVNEDVQPQNDVTSGGTQAWVTGNAGSNPGENDVDAGTSILDSPLLDATDFESATLEYWRFFYASPTTVPASDFFRIMVSNDGQSWITLESVGSTENSWIQRSVSVPFTMLSPDLRVRFEVEDSSMAFINSTVEGLVDDVRLTGLRIECEPFTAPVIAAPNGVGDTLQVEITTEGDVRLFWQAPSTDVSHDAADVYNVYRSASASSGFAVETIATETSRLLENEATVHDSAFWLVTATNGGGESGDIPAP
jgi:serine protease AprX